MSKTMTTTVHHLVGKRFVGITPDQQRVMMDGETTAPTGMGPMQLLLNAVGACAALDIVGMLAKRKLAIRGYRIELTGHRLEETPRAYHKVVARHIFDVPGLDERTATRFVGLGMTKYCSVAASLKAEIDYEVVLEHEAGPAPDQGPGHDAEPAAAGT